METILTIQMPFKRIKRHATDLWYHSLFSWGGGSIQEFGGSRINKTRHLLLFRWHLLTVRRNQYHDRSDKERADEYLSKWSACERELRNFKLAALGEAVPGEVRKLIKESLGVDLDEGRI